MPGRLKTDWDSNKLKSIEFKPNTIIDVGAAAGTEVLYEAFPDSYFILIEPLKEYESHLQEILKKYQGEYFVTAVGDHIGQVEINIESNDLERTSIHTRSILTASNNKVIKREIGITTLDALQKEHQFKPPFGLKIDTEGYEVQVIKGSSKLLGQTDFIIAEVSVAQRFENSYTFAQFIDLMNKNNFALYDILYEYRKDDKLMYADCLFKKLEIKHF